MLTSRERLARNQTLFREVNERIKEVADPVDGGVDFLCECSNTDCTTSIPLTLTEYEAVRSESAWFFVEPGHEQLEVERVVSESERFTVVEKLLAEEFLEQTDPRA